MSPFRRLLPFLLLAMLVGCGRGEEVTVLRSSLEDASLPPASLDGWRRDVWIDFGPRDLRASGALAVSAVIRYREVGWSRGLVRNGTRRGGTHPFFDSWIEGQGADFKLGLNPSLEVVRVRLALGDARSARGPVDVALNGKPVLTAVTTRAGEILTLDAVVSRPEGRLVVSIQARDCRTFSTPGLALYVADPPGAGETVEGVLASRFPTPSPVVVPRDLPVGDLPARARRLLRETADHLEATGFEDGRFSASGFWYENSFPVRALIAAGRCFETDRDTRAALRTLDIFVAAQRSDGNWDAEYFGPPDCPSAGSETRSSNLADVGAMALSLALAAPRARGDRAGRYRDALDRYLRDVVLPEQMATGAFPNRRYRGVDYPHPYSVATGVQAAVLAAGFGLTGDPVYAAASTRAGGYLADQVQPDGGVVFHPFHADRPELRDARSLGDLFYVIEGLLMAHRLPGPDRRRIGEALERIFHGDRGVLKAVEEESWWEPTDAWEESKRSGLLYLWLVARREMEWDPRPEFESRLLTAISESPYREWLGVCVSPEAPEGLHAYQATGFAGMSAAAAIEPGWVLAPERTAP